MGNIPPYQPDQPDGERGYETRQGHESPAERPHDPLQDRPAFYQSTNQAAAQTSEAQSAQRLRIRRRPCGVMLMSAFLLFQGIFLLTAGVFGVLGIVALIFDVSRGSMLLLHGLISFALGILSIIFAFGMFMLTRWAFWAAVVIAFFNLMTSLTVLLQTGFTSFGHIISGIFSLIVLFYFVFDPDARAAFTKEAPSLFEF